MPKLYPTLSIRQPWAGLLALGIKPIENRSWCANPKYYKEEFLFHAGKLVDRDAMCGGNSIIDAAECLVSYVGGDVIEFKNRLIGNEHVFNCGGIVGRATLAGCSYIRSARWGRPNQNHWVFTCASPVPFQPLKGRLGIFMTNFEVQKNE
ncbi:hypothetical protein [Desulfovibrio sp. UCD-KL4C]|uniref:hypothetical protein n=1 Tax=Desulfovibrio sp. UCD-KL4C TaxID=2578120 RepID=UPI0025C392E5|nr:hypothetical protein [Desulfovibrio sp. UCD-KL4C]